MAFKSRLKRNSKFNNIFFSNEYSEWILINYFTPEYLTVQYYCSLKIWISDTRKVILTSAERISDIIFYGIENRERYIEQDFRDRVIHINYKKTASPFFVWRDSGRTRWGLSGRLARETLANGRWGTCWSCRNNPHKDSREHRPPRLGDLGSFWYVFWLLHRKSFLLHLYQEFLANAFECLR